MTARHPLRERRASHCVHRARSGCRTSWRRRMPPAPEAARQRRGQAARKLTCGIRAPRGRLPRRWLSCRCADAATDPSRLLAGATAVVTVLPNDRDALVAFLLKVYIPERESFGLNQISTGHCSVSRGLDPLCRTRCGRFSLHGNRASRLATTFGRSVMGWSSQTRVGGAPAAPTPRVLDRRR